MILLDARVEDLVVEERGRLGLEEDACSAFFDHSSSSAGSETTLSWKLACVPARSAPD